MSDGNRGSSSVAFSSNMSNGTSNSFLKYGGLIHRSPYKKFRNAMTQLFNYMFNVAPFYKPVHLLIMVLSNICFGAHRCCRISVLLREGCKTSNLNIKINNLVFRDFSFDFASCRFTPAVRRIQSCCRCFNFNFGINYMFLLQLASDAHNHTDTDFQTYIANDNDGLASEHFIYWRVNHQRNHWISV